MQNNNPIMDEVTPLAFFLSQNYPNPFSERTTIKYCVAYKTRVQITVFDSDDKVIEKLVDEEKQPGTYEVEFSLCHPCESRDPEGVKYIYRLEAGEYKSEKKMILIK